MTRILWTRTLPSGLTIARCSNVSGLICPWSRSLNGISTRRSRRATTSSPFKPAISSVLPTSFCRSVYAWNKLMANIIDAHQHFWQLSLPFEYGWLAAPQNAPIRRDFLPEHLEPHLRAVGVQRTVFVQTQHNLEENRWALT